nr:neuronal membrane glycoprotein M6-b isoform X3 [Dasypus novemcinctus]
MGCFECCIKCLGGVPYASLVATILCFSGVALFCGCGHVALAGTVAILEQHFSTNTSDHALLSEVIQLMQYVIYGIASFFFLYGIILLAEGFYTTSAVKELHGEFKTTACGRCISGMFVFLTYVLGVAWLGVFGFSAVPVFMFYNIWSTCEVIKSPQANGTAGVEQICVDIRQYGTASSSRLPFFSFKDLFLFLSPSPLPLPPPPLCALSVHSLCVLLCLFVSSAALGICVSFCCIILLHQLSMCAVPLLGRLCFFLHGVALLAGHTPCTWVSPAWGKPMWHSTPCTHQHWASSPHRSGGPGFEPRTSQVVGGHCIS